MKKIIVFILSIGGLGTLLISLLFFGNYYFDDKHGQREHFKELIGEYRLDLKRSKLKSYGKDSLMYKNLTIHLNANSTFSFNMKAPFLFDTCGCWKAVGYQLEELNELVFENCSDHDKKTGKYGGHFTQVYNPDSVRPVRVMKNKKAQNEEVHKPDTIFSIMYITPQTGNLPVGELYFIKIKY